MEKLRNNFKKNETVKEFWTENLGVCRRNLDNARGKTTLKKWNSEFANCECHLRHLEN